jgi:hypothetical protein
MIGCKTIEYNMLHGVRCRVRGGRLEGAHGCCVEPATAMEIHNPKGGGRRPM